MSNGRATRGGQVGTNGEFYAGGTFLPSTTLPKGTPKTRRPSSPRRQQISRYEWAETPREGARSIYTLIVGTRAIERDGVISRYEPGIAYYSEIVWGDHNVNDLIVAFNAGERWVEA